MVYFQFPIPVLVWAFVWLISVITPNFAIEHIELTEYIKRKLNPNVTDKTKK